MPCVNESYEHKTARRLGVAILRLMGFKPQQIKHEKHFSHKIKYGKYKYRRDHSVPDIVGLSRNFKVAVECGNARRGTLRRLEKYFDQVVWVSKAKPIKRKLTIIRPSERKR